MNVIYFPVPTSTYSPVPIYRVGWSVVGSYFISIFRYLSIGIRAVARVDENVV